MTTETAAVAVAVTPGEATITEGHTVTEGVVQNVEKHAARKAAAEKAMREIRAQADKPAEEAEAAAPDVALTDPAPPPDAEEPSKPETPKAKADERSERIKRFIAAKSEKGELQQIRAQMAAQAEEYKRQVEQARQEARREILEQVQKAPKALFETHNIAPQDLLSAAMEEATQDPVKLLERKYAALEAKLQAEAQERARLQQSLTEREQQATIQQQQTVALQAALDAEKYPALAARYESAPQQLLAAMSSVAEEYHARTGAWPSYSDVAEYIDSQEQEVFARYSGGAKAGRPSSAAQSKPRIGNGITPSAATSSAGAPEPKAISHEERLRRAKAAEAMLRRNTTRSA